MATKRPAKPRMDPLQEAADPNTDPERLRGLVQHDTWEVARAAIMNPSLPDDAWRKEFVGESPEAWANPMAPFYLLTWTQSEDDSLQLSGIARLTAFVVWRNPERCSPEGKALLDVKLEEWWVASEHATSMMSFLMEWGQAKGIGSPEHREVVRLLVLCVRTAPDLSVKDLKALDLLEAWTAGGKDQRKKAGTLADFGSVIDTALFAQDPSKSAWNAIRTAVEAVANYNQGTKREEAIAEHNRLLADVIRRERPVPPVVD
jgi:hypothetical protein